MTAHFSKKRPRALQQGASGNFRLIDQKGEVSNPLEDYLEAHSFATLAGRLSMSRTSLGFMPVTTASSIPKAIRRLR